MFDDSSERDALTGMIESGSTALGAAAGAGIGMLIGDPSGPVIGAAAGSLLESRLRAVAGDVAARFTARTEQERMGTLYILTQNQIMRRLKAGDTPRSAAFFRPRERANLKRLRSEADELLEGAFLAAQRSYEERKIGLLANFYTNVAFRDNLDSGHANYILSLMESLTYRQLVGIFIIGNGKLPNFSRTSDFRSEESLDPLQVGVLFELYQLVKLDLIADSSSKYILGVADITPSRLILQGTGAEIFNLMGPLTLDFDEYGYFVNAFRPDLTSQISTSQKSKGIE